MDIFKEIRQQLPSIDDVEQGELERLKYQEGRAREGLAKLVQLVPLVLNKSKEQQVVPVASTVTGSRGKIIWDGGHYQGNILELPILQALYFCRQYAHIYNSEPSE